MEYHDANCGDGASFKAGAAMPHRAFFDVDSPAELMKKISIALAGGIVLIVGIALLVLPGPGLPLVAAGLAILGTQFLWARRALRNAKGAVAKVRRRTGLSAWLRRRRSTRRDVDTG